jgi:Asp/Glu/hydantoin racemase
MTPTIALIHTSPSMVPVFKPLADELLPGVAVFNMVDESLLRDITREGRLIPSTAKRLVGHVLAAVDAGATHVLVTCSSMGPAVESAATLTTATVLRVDEPMARKAVSIGKRVGVIATLPSTLAPTADLIRRRAEGIELKPRLVEGAFAAVISGDGGKHDRLVGDALREMSGECDVIVLAQASMARAAAALPAGEVAVPVLSSPRSSIEYLATLVV